MFRPQRLRTSRTKCRRRGPTLQQSLSQSLESKVVFSALLMLSKSMPSVDEAIRNVDLSPSMAINHSGANLLVKLIRFSELDRLLVRGEKKYIFLRLYIQPME